MNQQGQTAVATATNGAAPAAPKKIDVLKSIMNADSVKEQFQNALGKNSGTFIASVIDLYNNSSDLQLCEPKQVVMEALKAAVLHLPINKALGYAYVIPFKNTKRINGQYQKVMEPSFQMGYKGYIQLAMRTGRYRILNADVVYEGELKSVNKLTGEINLDGEKKSDKVVGYFCYFELLDGFHKSLYMSVEQMANHAKKYSKGLVKYENGNRVDVSVESLVNLAALPVATDNGSVGWMGNFHSMAVKTVIRALLSKYGYLSIEMQNAIINDFEGDSVEQREDLIHNVANTKALDIQDAEVVQIGAQEQPQPQPQQQNNDDPGF